MPAVTILFREQSFPIYFIAPLEARLAIIAPLEARLESKWAIFNRCSWESLALYHYSAVYSNVVIHVQYGKKQCTLAQYSAVQYDTGLYITVKCCTVRHSAVLKSTV